MISLYILKDYYILGTESDLKIFLPRKDKSSKKYIYTRIKDYAIDYYTKNPDKITPILDTWDRTTGKAYRKDLEKFKKNHITVKKVPELLHNYLLFNFYLL